MWLERPPRKICSIGVHISRWVTTHGYALNVDLDPAPFTEWITACGLEDAAFTTMARELSRPVTVDEVRPVAAAMLGEVFDLELEELPATAAGDVIWPQPLHERLASRSVAAAPDTCRRASHRWRPAAARGTSCRGGRLRPRGSARAAGRGG